MSFEGTTFERLYNTPQSFPLASKITSAQRPGIHAEILVVNQMIIEMRAAGKTINTLSDVAANGGTVVVKGKDVKGLAIKHAHMPTCPHCHNILKQAGIVVESF